MELEIGKCDVWTHHSLTDLLSTALPRLSVNKSTRGNKLPPTSPPCLGLFDFAVSLGDLARGSGVNGSKHEVEEYMFSIVGPRRLFIAGSGLLELEHPVTR